MWYLSLSVIQFVYLECPFGFKFFTSLRETQSHLLNQSMTIYFFSITIDI